MLTGFNARADIKAIGVGLASFFRCLSTTFKLSLYFNIAAKWLCDLGLVSYPQKLWIKLWIKNANAIIPREMRRIC